MSSTMTYEPLHHKYRPQRFADLVGQTSVVQTLSNAIRLGKIAPAYLFCGPRGTGKTSSARILAKSLNCVQGPTPDPCNQCPSCRAITNGSALDVIEIDAASNTGVDNIRELIERSQFAPVSSRYKVYVLDEVHMLSTAAFNALLKTLEEPPAHVVFVLATTDPQRVLPTVISRCQRFDYRRIPLPDLVAHLHFISEQEQIQATPAALELIGQIAQGGLRDAESLLDQLSLLPAITPEAVWDLVGAVPERELLALMEAIARSEAETVIRQVRHLLDHGKEPLAVLQGLVGFYRDLLLAQTAPQQRELVAVTQSTWDALVALAAQTAGTQILQWQHALLRAEPTLRHTPQPRLWLEICLLDLLTPSITDSPPVPRVATATPAATLPAVAPPITPPSTPAVATAPPPDRSQPPAKPVEPAPTPSTVLQTPPAPPPSLSKTLAPQWETFLQRLTPVSQALFRMAHVHEERDRVVVLAFPSPGFAQKAQGRLASIQPILTDLLGRSVTVEFTTGVTTKAAPPPPSPPSTPAVVKSQPTSAPTAPDLPAAPAAVPDLSTPSPVSNPRPQPVMETDVLRSAHQLASFFNGSVVSDEPAPPSELAIAPELDDEDALPF